MGFGRTAVVLGGSMGGLSTAGALAPHFDQVLVLERDELPHDAEHRKGVPQSKHPHFLLNSGRRALGELFPGFEADLIAAGGMPLIASMDTAHMTDAGWSPRKKGALDMVYGSRLLIERVLRDRVRALGNVTIRESVSVRGVQTANGGSADGRVTGVVFTSREGTEEVEADLVVDALGRGSSVSDWLVKAGWPEVPVLTLDAKVVYVSQWYELPPAEEKSDNWWWKHMVIMPTENKGDHPIEHDYLSNFFPIEGNRSIACMGSWGLDMPTNEEEFVEASGRLQTPKFLEAMEASTAISEVHLTRSTGNKWRRFDKLPKPPQGILFVGDSICAFNPFYGQGMSSAALSALRLSKTLDSTDSLDTTFYKDFLASQAKEFKVAWTMAMARDRGYDIATGTETVPGWMRKILAVSGAAMFNTITGASREDHVVDEHFARVFNLDEPIGTMMRNPRVIYGLIRFKIKQKLGRLSIPTGFDPQLDPPGKDWSTDAIHEELIQGKV